jgi:hypothetical protein
VTVKRTENEERAKYDDQTLMMTVNSKNCHQKQTGKNKIE